MIQFILLRLALANRGLDYIEVYALHVLLGLSNKTGLQYNIAYFIVNIYSCYIFLMGHSLYGSIVAPSLF